MAYKARRFPLLNPVRFITANDALTAGYNTWPFDRGFFAEQTRSWEQKISYEQKWQAINDLICLYFDSLAPSVRFYIVGEDGASLFNFDLTPVTIAGNNAPNGDQYYTYKFPFTLDGLYPLPVEQKVLYFVLEHLYDVPGSDLNTWNVSEPQYFRLATKWDDTVLIEYTNDTTDYDVYFEDLTPIFKFRVEGAIKYLEPGSNETSFEDQQYVSRKLEAVPKRLYQFTLGGPEGIPDYVLDKINAIFACDKFKIEGILFTKVGSPKWTVKSVDGYPLKVATIQLEEYNPHDGTTEVDARERCLLCRIPLATPELPYFPLCFSRQAMHGTFGSFSFPDVFFVPDDDVLFNVYIDEHLNPYALAHGLTGHYDFVIVDGELWLAYINGPGEDYVPSEGNYCWYKFLKLSLNTGTFTIPIGGYPFHIRFAGAVNIGWQAKIMVVTDFTRQMFTSNYGTGSGDYGPISDVTAYLPAGGATVYIFHAGSASDFNTGLCYLEFPDSSVDHYIHEVLYEDAQTTVPPTLKVYKQRNQGQFGANNHFDYRVLLAANARLIEMNLDNSGLNDITPAPLSASLTTFYFLKFIALGNNHIPSAQLETFANNITHLGPSPGYIGMMQDPASPITDGGALYQIGSFISFYGWTIDYDS